MDSRRILSDMINDRTFSEVCATSALPPKADIAGRQLDVRFVPKADIEERYRDDAPSSM
jgi:hypothetical protein